MMQFSHVSDGVVISMIRSCLEGLLFSVWSDSSTVILHAGIHEDRRLLLWPDSCGRRLGALLEVLPLQIPALRHSSTDSGAQHRAAQHSAGGRRTLGGKGRIPYVKLCGLRLPDTLTPAVDEPHEAQVGACFVILPLCARELQKAQVGPFSGTLCCCACRTR